MKWIKQGRIFIPNGQAEWVATHGMLPVAYCLGGDIYRIYFSGRDKNNVSSIGYVEIDINNPQKILKFSEKPVLERGQIGSFDDSGVSPTCIIPVDDKLYMYYLGWNRGSMVKASEVSGLAISSDGGITFERYSRAPIIDRTKDEPYLILVISCILLENGIWRMWYDASDFWLRKDLPHYNIKYSESKDGITWVRNGEISVDYKDFTESRVSRASVIKEDVYKMWFCSAVGDAGYRMGYAESADGIKFDRKESVGIDVSPSGWDSEMICYPFVFTHKGKKHMFYCGNSYGKTGFGHAILEEG